LIVFVPINDLFLLNFTIFPNCHLLCPKFSSPFNFVNQFIIKVSTFHANFLFGGFNSRKNVFNHPFYGIEKYYRNFNEKIY